MCVCVFIRVYVLVSRLGERESEREGEIEVRGAEGKGGGGEAEGEGDEEKILFSVMLVKQPAKCISGVVTRVCLFHIAVGLEICKTFCSIPQQK